ncbi:MAG: hypothetical protein AAGE98_04560 [Actinomycetota bacterium]
MSMLTSITPLGERARGQRWGVTATALTVGHLVGGVVLGAVMAGLGTLIRLPFDGSFSTTVQVAVVAAAVVAAAAFDLSGRSLPGRRQVDETWLTTFRGWIYGLGFGVQLGLGFVTVVNTGLFVAVVIAGLVVSPPSAFVIGVAYGGLRGLLAVANARVRTIDDLKTLHRRLDAVDDRVRVAGASAAGALGVAALAVGAGFA